MLTLEQLKQAVHQRNISKTDVTLLCVAAGGGKSVSTSDAKKLAISSGVRRAAQINFSAHLHSAEDKVFKVPDGWELTDKGRKYVAGLAAVQLTESPAAAEAQSLRALLPKLKNADARAFLAEAIVCAEQSLFRAAVVLSWVGAMALLHDHVIAKHLSAMND